jgi:hypothetical protein
MAAPQVSFENNEWSAVFYINSNLHVVAYSNATPVEFSAVTASNGWNQMDAVCNYTSQTWSIALNGTGLASNLAFNSSNAQFSTFAVRDVVNTTTSYVDSISLRSAAVDPNGDDDADGLPDAWEMEHFGNLDANPGDPAANGVNTVLDCYIAGLDPIDPDAAFLISDLSPLTSVLSWSAASGRVYSVYWTTNLLNGFQPLETNLPWTGNVYTDSVHSSEQQGFYQIKVNLQ